MFNLEELQWNKMEGLLPAIIQHADTGKVLMIGYMNQAAIAATIKQRKVIFYSRSKQRLWCKGETSGNSLVLVNIVPDCDKDALLILALPQGPTCHHDTLSCFKNASFNMELIGDIENIIEARKQGANDKSYVYQLLTAGVNRIAQKVGEEAVETAIAAVCQTNESFCEEMADLFFHLQVLLSVKGLTFLDIIEVLKGRRSGLSS